MPTARSRVPSPVPHCTPLFDAAATRDADARATADHGIPSLLLMERAGLETAAAARAAYPDARRAVVLVGAGNNGGDGMVVARHLAEAGWEVTVASPGGDGPSTPDAALMTTIAGGIGIPVTAFDAAAGRPAGAVLVDALLGPGTRGAPRGAVAAMVAWTAGWPGPVVAVDVPTGVDADTGAVAGDAVRADLTVTFHGDKVGLHVAPGRGRAGRVEVVDIAIPSAVASDPAAWLVHGGAATAIPPKDAAGEKYSAGAVLVVAGAPGMTGAGVLAALATLRAGAGLAVAAVPAAVQPLMAPLMLEVMCAPVADDAGRLCAASADDVLREAGRVSAVALGPGIGRASATTAAVLGILERLELPVVLDADGLWHLEGRPEALAARPAATVITPHAGEAARLLGSDRAAVEAERLAAAHDLAARSGAVVVLKGPGTVIAAPGQVPLIAAGGGPSLSTAGSGDVLTGIIAAALAKGLPARTAAAAGVALHAAAGDRAGRGDGMIAGDLLDVLPATMAALRAGTP
ncbi:MAG: NAD(P)H-hydrate dehydratase [Thermoleophilia bacterium]|nr:NAD(P)H-hydrate dehydratase [Thermoleophilia bacterium]